MHSYLYSASSFLQQYQGALPMHLALRNFFRSDKKFGARDRRWITEICFAAMRTNAAYLHLEAEQQLLTSLLLSVKRDEGIVRQIFGRSGWEVPEEVFGADSSVKKEWLAAHFGIHASGDFFPMTDHLSLVSDKDKFIESHLRQRYVWLRIRRNHKKETLSALAAAGFTYHQHPHLEFAVALDPGVKLDDLEIIRKGYAEIQDVSSQQTLAEVQPEEGEHWLDVCAASGGKSLLLLEKQPKVLLTVCDVRASILENLKERFKRNNVKYADMVVADLTASASIGKFKNSFDGIIADVPCSGSGTWGRTPEQMRFFSREKLQEYVIKQRAILSNVIKLLKPGGTLVYITCSVYRDENEDQVGYLTTSPGMELLHSGLTEGYETGADTLFSAVLTRR